MKTIFKTSLLLLISMAFFNCNNDDGNAANQDQCNYSGLSYVLSSNTTKILIPETELTTDFFNTSTNGPEVEIFKTDDPGNFWFLTTVVTANTTGTGTLNLGGTVYPVNVTCQRTGNAVGQEMRYDITSSSLEAEFCVVIDFFH
ncbi:hypothetical protein ACFSX9_12515 [Flavobacterium ardleyense]|uniref:Lipoprotein n=1 Tax=Flavobacterium ardleyense TaxID=2038737 RepID=A0ABW5Z9M5_9FLAO